jgi:hypothetical protein
LRATRWLPEYLTGLLFSASAAISGAAGDDFRCFDSGAFWPVLLGFVLRGAIRKSG